MLIEDFLNAPILSHSRADETHRMLRLCQLQGYLAGTLSPLDLECIENLHDHKGCLEVTLNQQKILHISQINASYTEYLKQKIYQGWIILMESEIEFKFQ